ncbi:MAG: hypothetical protein A3K19_08820 [Lentisphaerae bacterium RIFOXYB12_FULL_65_16]|nr:MAG: hypothetical protein A3K18_02745 [Lentisphaerae bacterium RIFOXYA12_64_32]OGV86034.1 MAG: hypothetical protein A3K19_08820 [Lentisphaerae bacterium RIFOXYB12_FULL_65_16]
MNLVPRVFLVVLSCLLSVDLAADEENATAKVFTRLCIDPATLQVPEDLEARAKGARAAARAWLSQVLKPPFSDTPLVPVERVLPLISAGHWIDADQMLARIAQAGKADGFVGAGVLDDRTYNLHEGTRDITITIFPAKHSEAVKELKPRLHVVEELFAKVFTFPSPAVCGPQLIGTNSAFSYGLFESETTNGTDPRAFPVRSIYYQTDGAFVRFVAHKEVNPCRNYVFTTADSRFKPSVVELVTPEDAIAPPKPPEPVAPKPAQPKSVIEALREEYGRFYGGKEPAGTVEERTRVFAAFSGYDKEPEPARVECAFGLLQGCEFEEERSVRVILVEKGMDILERSLGLPIRTPQPQTKQAVPEPAEQQEFDQLLRKMVAAVEAGTPDEAAWQALGYKAYDMVRSSTVPLFCRAISSDSLPGKVRERLLDAMRQKAPRGAAPFLCELLVQSPDPLTRRTAARAVGDVVKRRFLFPDKNDAALGY